MSSSLVWIITGCSSGFGLSLARIALQAGHRVVATSRTPSKTPELVSEFEKLGGIWLPLDVMAPLSTHQSLVSEAVRVFGRVDILVNGAGMATIGAVEDFRYISPNAHRDEWAHTNPSPSHEEAHTIMETNFFGPLKLTQSILPHLRAQRSGTVVNISSGAGIDPTTSMALYAASKCALEGLSQCMAKEVASFGIRVLIVQPGAFRTNMTNAVTITEKFTPAYEGTPLGEFVGLFKGSPKDRTFKPANDVEKGAQSMFEVITGTGRGTGKEGFLRLVLSSDVAQRTLDQTERSLQAREAFTEIWESTGHDVEGC